MSVPNQRIIMINRAHSAKKNFTQVDKEISAKVFKELTYHEFKLWYYLCGNTNGYRTELSYVAVKNQTDIKRSSYYDAFNALIKKGYIQLVQGNLYNFFELPVRPVDTIEPAHESAPEYEF